MKIFLILFFSAFLYANDLLQSINDFNEQNIKIYELNKFLLNENEKGINKNKISSEINELKTKKTQILGLLPAFINKDNLSKKLIQSIKKEKINIDLKKAKEYFYTCLITINENFITNNEEHIKDIIDEHIKDISSISTKKEDVEIEINSYIEILTYLRINANIFEGNYFFKKVKTDEFLNKFNSYFSSEINEYLNPGKILASLLILSFIFVFKKVLIKVLFSTILLFNKNKQTINLLNSLSKPVVVIFYTYGLWLCTIISFYPAPIMPIFAMIFGIINTLLITWLLISILNNYGLIALSNIAKKSKKKEIINLMLRMVYIIIIFIAILLILRKLGFDISAIIASLGIGGLAVALAAKDIIANFLASVLVSFDNSFSQGDWVVIDSVEGTIVETGLRQTTIRTFDNSLVFIPNSKIMNANIKNWSKRKLGRKIGLTIGIEYGASTKQIQNILNDLRTMLKNHPGVAQPEIDTSINKNDFHSKYRQNIISVDDLDGYKNTLFVYLDEFANSSINIVIYCFSKTVVWGEFLKVKEDIMLKAMQIVENNGSSFAFPSTSVYIEKMPKD